MTTDKIIPHPIIRLRPDTVVEHKHVVYKNLVGGYINWGQPIAYAGKSRILGNGGSWFPGSVVLPGRTYNFA